MFLSKATFYVVHVPKTLYFSHELSKNAVFFCASIKTSTVSISPNRGNIFFRTFFSFFGFSTFGTFIEFKCEKKERSERRGLKALDVLREFYDPIGGNR
jgi:hypothetical protein